jgi:predicted RNase H-like HicB family nuclease
MTKIKDLHDRWMEDAEYACEYAALAAELGAPASTSSVRATASYIALVHKDADTSYGVSFPDVPGCISAGDTLEEALVNAAEALAFHFDGMEEDEIPIPTPRSYEQLRKDPEFMAEASEAIVAAVPLRARQSHAQ